jgi:hypothetical protein
LIGHQEPQNHYINSFTYLQGKEPGKEKMSLAGDDTSYRGEEEIYLGSS